MYCNTVTNVGNLLFGFVFDRLLFGSKNFGQHCEFVTSLFSYGHHQTLSVSAAFRASDNSRLDKTLVRHHHRRYLCYSRRRR